MAIGEAIAERVKQKAKERQSVAGPQEGKGAKPTASGKFPEAVKGDSRDQIGAAVGMSGKTFEKARV